jgi:hypothetical protein
MDQNTGRIVRYGGVTALALLDLILFLILCLILRIIWLVSVS